MESKQTVYKGAGQYYQIQKEELLKKGYEIIEDDNKKTVFVKKDSSLIDKETNI